MELESPRDRSPSEPVTPRHAASARWPRSITMETQELPLLTWRRGLMTLASGSPGLFVLVLITTLCTLSVQVLLVVTGVGSVVLFAWLLCWLSMFRAFRSLVRRPR